MGLPELLIVIVSLVAAPMLLMAVVTADRVLKGRIIPVGWRGKPIVTMLFLSCAVCVSVIAMSVVRPSESSAADTGGEEEPIEVADGAVRVFVYPLENWGDKLRRLGAGEQFARVAIDTIREEGFHTEKGVEHYIPLDIFQTETQPSESLKAIYRRRIPFVCVWGTISRKRDGGLEIQLSVDSVDATLRPKQLLSKTVGIAESPDAVPAAAKELGREIAGLLE